MIPREIPKKIRPTGTRPNGLVTELVFWPALTCVLSPRRGFQPTTTHLVYSPGRLAHPAAGFPKDAVSVSPSPWGEGWDEGGRKKDFLLPYSRSRASRSSISAKTCSAGIPRPGFLSASSARRSSSAICSGVSSSSKSPNSISMVSIKSRRSVSGIRRSSSRISALLMPSIYADGSPMQAGFRASRFTLHDSRLPRLAPRHP